MNPKTNKKMEAKPKTSFVPFNFGANGGTHYPFKNTRRTLRNDPCPCGKHIVKVYRDAKGEIFKEVKVPVKFKKCCLTPETK